LANDDFLVRTAKAILWSVSLLAVFATASCVARKLEVVPLDTTAKQPVTVDSPVKAHLTDGSTVVFNEGVTISDGQVTGKGRKYGIDLKNSVPVSLIDVDEVAVMESYQTPVKVVPTATVNAMAAPFYILLAVVASIALLGP
jgi:hypothetical protein